MGLLRSLAPPVGMVGLLVILSTTAAAFPGNTIEYWRQFGEAPHTDPCVQLARALFDKVAAAAGVPPVHRPSLWITAVTPGSGVHAVALSSGWIVLTRGLLTRVLAHCDQATPIERQARLAFILGHELGHLLRHHPAPPRPFASMAGEPDAVPGQERQEQEYEADRDGIVYTAMAGLPTYAIVTHEDSFFEAWEQQERAYMSAAREQLPRDPPDHPPPAARAGHVRQHLQQIQEAVEVFQIGLQFYQAGQYARAIPAFATFRQIYPSPEAIHNLALSYYQYASQVYCYQQHEVLVPWHLPLSIDPITTAMRIQLDRQYKSRSPGTSLADVRDYLDKALGFYREVITPDHPTTRAAMHLSAALIARSRLHVAPALREADLYEALSYLQKALAEEPLSASVRTTLGVVYLSQGRQEEALRIWQQVAQQEGEASFAAANLRALQHQAAASPGDVATCDVRAQHAAPTTTKRERIQQIVVGSYTGALPQVWGTPYERTFLFEGGFPQTEQGTMALVVSDYPNGLRTLSQDQSVVMIQVQTAYKGHSLQDVTIGDTATHVRERYGEPVRILPVWHGESWSYDTLGIAFRLHDGIVVSWVLY